MALGIIRFIVVAICCTAAGLNLVHILQENNYDRGSIKERLKISDVRIWRNILISAAAGFADFILPTMMTITIQQEELRTSVCGWSVLVLFTVGVVISCFADRDTDTEEEFVLTQRSARLIAGDFLLMAAIIYILTLCGLPVYFALVAGCHAIFGIAWAVQPLEKLLNAHYYKNAKKKISAQKKMIRIGIIGSYGKTEVKMILKALLSKKYKVLTTPPNFSALMGIARTINDQLKPEHQVFIAEMGASKKGEIAEMTRMVKPRYGILTCISARDKGGFRSVEAAAESMNEMLLRIPKSGTVVFGADGGYSDRMYALHKGNKRNAGALSERKCYVQAQNIDTGLHGTRFELCCEDGRHIWAETKLLGMYSIRNIAIAATIALEMGLTMEQIAEAVKQLKPFKHHLQLIPGEVNIIDDSLNRNPEAAEQAMKVLAEFPGRRIVVCAGFDGSKEAAYKFGTSIPDCADHVLLIGTRQTRDIAEALKDCDFPSASVHSVKLQSEAIEILKSITGKGDTVLYEGILPDGTDEE